MKGESLYKPLILGIIKDNSKSLTEDKMTRYYQQITQAKVYKNIKKQRIKIILAK